MTPARDDLPDRLAALPPDAWDAPAPPRFAPPATPRTTPLARHPALAVLAVAALLGVGLALGVLLAPGDGASTAPGPRLAARVALARIGGGEPRAAGEVALTPRAGGRAEVQVHGLRPLRAGYYEVWLMNSGRDLVSLGSFRVSRNGRAQVTIRLPVDPRRYAVVDVSREPDDGDPQHSGHSVLRGPLT